MRTFWDVGLVIGLMAWVVCAAAMVSGAGFGVLVILGLGVVGVAVLVTMVWPR